MCRKEPTEEWQCEQEEPVDWEMAISKAGTRQGLYHYYRRGRSRKFCHGRPPMCHLALSLHSERAAALNMHMLRALLRVRTVTSPPFTVKVTVSPYGGVS